MKLVLIVLQVTLSSDLNEAEVMYQPALGMSDLAAMNPQLRPSAKR